MAEKPTFGDRNYIGLAGEFRVMSELFLRRHNPAKSYMQNGADLILENGLRIEVKCAHHYRAKRKYGKPGKKSTPHGYNFSFRSRHKKFETLKEFDYAICWCIDDNVFYVIPVNEITGGGLHLADISTSAKHKLNIYRNNWEQLGGK